MHRFYGPAPHSSGDWLQVPARLFWAYATEMDPLQARESMALTNEIMYASGHMAEEGARDFARLLSQRAIGEDGPKPTRPSSMAELARLGGGISKVRVAP